MIGFLMLQIYNAVTFGVTFGESDSVSYSILYLQSWRSKANLW